MYKIYLYSNMVIFFKMSKKNKSWESLAWIIIGVFILSLVILWIGKLLSHSNDIIASYNDATNMRILKSNLSHILLKIDTSNILENQVFYIYKDTTHKEFKAYTGTTNATYKYIDVDWNHIADVTAFEKDIYARFLYIQREDTALNSQNQVIRASIKKLIKK